MPCSTNKKENVKWFDVSIPKKGMKGSGKCRTSVTYIYTDMAKFCKTYMRLYITTEKIKKKMAKPCDIWYPPGARWTHFPDHRRRRVIT